MSSRTTPSPAPPPSSSDPSSSAPSSPGSASPGPVSPGSVSSGNGHPAASHLPRLEDQLRFVLEIDRLKTVLRRTLLTDGSRRENSAEHSWHLALMAVVLAEHAAEPVAVDRVVRLLLVHDLVEIDAGDTFVYDTVASADKQQREELCAERVFALLPPEQGAELRALWDEFEERATPEARFAAALDRLQPILHNMATEGHSWRHHGISAEQVLERNRHMSHGAPTLWEHVRRLVDAAVERGWLAG